jgi:hypothetical protein
LSNCSLVYPGFWFLTVVSSDYAQATHSNLTRKPQEKKAKRKLSRLIPLTPIIKVWSFKDNNTHGWRFESRRFV